MIALLAHHYGHYSGQQELIPVASPHGIGYSNNSDEFAYLSVE